MIYNLESSLYIIAIAVVFLLWRTLRKPSPVPVDDAPPKPTPLESLTPDTLGAFSDRAWRPFRWPYHQTMSIFKLPVNHWLSMDKWYQRYIDEKQRVWAEFRAETLGWLPESKDACEELLQLVAEHLTTRFPNLFRLSDDKGVFYNLVTKENVVIDPATTTQHPLEILAKLAKEDFYIVQQRQDGRHYLVAAAVPFPGGSFTVHDKLGQPLDAIHTEVPYYEQKLRPSMERWFGRLKCSELVERASFNFSWDHGLYTSQMNELSDEELAHTLPTIPPQQFNIRVEQQALRRLPQSRAIVFSNHPVFYSLDEMKDEAMVPSILRKILLEGPPDILKYKSFGKVRDHLVPYLDSLVARQIELCIITGDEPVRTLPSYPFAMSSPSESPSETQTSS